MLKFAFCAGLLCNYTTFSFEILEKTGEGDNGMRRKQQRMKA